MEEEVSAFISIIVSDPQLKFDFQFCLNQYVLYGNKGRQMIKENQIKKYLSRFLLNEKMKNLLRNESFFYVMYNATKHFLSTEYISQKIIEMQNNLQDLLLSVTQIFNEIHNSPQSIDNIPNIPRILQMCKQINSINNPFKNKSPQRSRKTKLINSIIQEIDDEIVNKSSNFNYIIQCNEAFVLSVISEGLNFSSIERFLAKNNIKACSKKIFYSTLQKLSSTLIGMANEVCYRNFLSIEKNTIVSFDSAWAH